MTLEKKERHQSVLLGYGVLGLSIMDAKMTDVDSILESFLKVLTPSFPKFDMWHYDEMLRHK